MTEHNKQKTHWWIIAAFVIVPLIVSVVSTIHVISFFELSNYYILSLILALSFELGALSGLAALTVLDKINKNVVWFIFILLTIFQMVGNTYYAYDTTTSKMLSNSNLIKNFSELFGFDIYDNTDVIFIKRMIAILTGGILPVISLSFLHLLMSYLGKIDSKKTELTLQLNSEPVVAIVQPEVIEQTITSIESIEKKTPEVTKVEQTVSDSETNQTIETKEEIEEPEDITPVEEKAEELLTEEQTITEKNPDTFESHLEIKRKKLEEDKKNFFPLLHTLFRDGTVKEGDELPSYSELMSMAEASKQKHEVIKIFLTLCNFLDITKMNGEVRRALMSYETAKKALEDYLSFDYEARP